MLPENPLELVRETVDYTPSRQQTRRMSLDAGADAGDLPMVTPFSRLLENLIRNAVDAMDGKGALVVRAHWLRCIHCGCGGHRQRHDQVCVPQGVSTRIHHKVTWLGIGVAYAETDCGGSASGQISVAYTEPGKGACFEWSSRSAYDGNALVVLGVQDAVVVLVNTVGVTWAEMIAVTQRVVPPLKGVGSSVNTPAHPIC